MNKTATLQQRLTRFFGLSFFGFSFIFSIGVMPAYAEVETIDKIAAVVGKGVVTTSELSEGVDAIKIRALAAGGALPEDEVLQKQVLEHLIVKQLQLQTAERVGLIINDEQVNEASENIRKNNQLSEIEFQRQIQNDGLSMEEYYNALREDITIHELQRNFVRGRIKISEAEIDNFLNSADGKFWISPEYRLAHILIALPQGADLELTKAAEQKSQALFEKLKEGADFSSLAIAHSDGQLALKGGDLGFRKTADLPTLFAEIVPSLKIGEVSKPAKSGAGFHLLKLIEKRGDETRIVTQKKVRHILLKTSAVLDDVKAKAKLSDIRAKISNGTPFEAMAKIHSEDIGSMLAGGDLGWSNPGQFVPEFEKVLEETAVNEVSPPFRSQFGWHILQVQEIKEEDMTDQFLRNKAVNVLAGRRFEDELQVWLRELRDDAFVDIKI